MFINKLKYRSGIALIEALVALVVISIGSVSIVLLLSNLTTGDAESKARNEAVAIANEQIQDLRNFMHKATVTGNYDSTVVGSNDTITGTNASFARTWTVSNSASVTDSKILTVTITWNNSSGTAQSITLSSMLGWLDPKQSLSFASGGGDGGGDYTGPNQDTAEVGHGVPVNVEDLGTGTDIGGGRTSYEDGDNTIIVNNCSGYDCELLLTVFSHDFLHISGTVFYDDTILSDLVGVTSDAGNCAFPLTSAGALISDQNNIVTVPGWGEMAEYDCIVASGWRGKVGILRLVDHKTSCPGQAREYIKFALDGTRFYAEGITLSHTDQDFFIATLNGNESCQDLKTTLEDTHSQTINEPFNLIVEGGDAITISGYIINTPGNALADLITIDADGEATNCRLLNDFDGYDDAYVCTVPQSISSGTPWFGDITTKLWTEGNGGNPNELLCTLVNNYPENPGVSDHIGVDDVNPSAAFTLTETCEGVVDPDDVIITIDFLVNGGSGGFKPEITSLSATDGACVYQSDPHRTPKYYYDCTMSADTGTITANMDLDGGSCSPITFAYDKTVTTQTIVVGCTNP
ncbi:MAG: hypothetical protein KZQ83_09335 [gamma proteobacterium symbiont of Taylorina sp.]|nr:hypothetical protein [gamma proteobacterium symbiont of Taylorina sp.]